MILRVWKARSDEKGMREYVRHAQTTVFPKVRRIAGNREAYLGTRKLEDGIEVIVLTLWDSIEAVRRFAGAEPERAVIEPEARAVLTSFDERVTHYSVVQHDDNE